MARNKRWYKDKRGQFAGLIWNNLTMSSPRKIDCLLHGMHHASIYMHYIPKRFILSCVVKRSVYVEEIERIFEEWGNWHFVTPMNKSMIRMKQIWGPYLGQWRKVQKARSRTARASDSDRKTGRWLSRSQRLDLLAENKFHSRSDQLIETRPHSETTRRLIEHCGWPKLYPLWRFFSQFSMTQYPS